MRRQHLIHESYGDHENRGIYDLGIGISIVGFFIAGGFFLYYTQNLTDLSAWIFILIGLAIMYGGWKMMISARRRIGRGHRISFG